MSVDPYALLPDFIKDALRDPDIEDVCADATGLVHAVRRKKQETIGNMHEHQRQLFLNAAAGAGTVREFSPRKPFLKKTLPNGERLEGHHYSLSPDGSSFVMRRQGSLLTLDDLVRSETMTRQQGECLKEAVWRGTDSVIIAGTTGAGKTTLLKAYLEEVNEKSSTEDVEQMTRWVAIEGETEVQQPLFGARIEIGENISFEDALSSMLRYRPRIIVVSEIKTTREAVGYVQAMLSGHIGATTVHAANAQLVRKRLRYMLPEFMGRDDELIDMATAIIVHVDKLPSGRRIVTSVLQNGEVVA